MMFAFFLAIIEFALTQNSDGDRGFHSLKDTHALLFCIHFFYTIFVCLITYYCLFRQIELSFFLLTSFFK